MATASVDPGWGVVDAEASEEEDGLGGTEPDVFVPHVLASRSRRSSRYWIMSSLGLRSSIDGGFGGEVAGANHDETKLIVFFVNPAVRLVNVC